MFQINRDVNTYKIFTCGIFSRKFSTDLCSSRISLEDKHFQVNSNTNNKNDCGDSDSVGVLILTLFSILIPIPIPIMILILTMII